MKLKIVRKNTSHNKVHFSMTGDMTIYSIKKLKDLLYGELKKSSGIILDLSGINQADTSAFQLILFLKREAEATERSFVIEDISDRLESVFDLYKERF